MRSLLTAVRETVGVQRKYLFVYAASFLWALSYALYTPLASVNLITQSGVYAWTGYTMLASTIGMIGILRKNNLLVERLGVSLLMLTPIIYSFMNFGIMMYEAFSPAPDFPLLRISGMFFGLWLYIPLSYRRRDLAARVKEATKTPLDTESGLY